MNYLRISLIMIFAMTAGCKANNQPTSEVKSNAAADKCDLQAMGKKSQSASKAAFQCSYQALKLAGDLGSGGSTKIIEFVDGINDIKDGLESVKPLIDALKEYLNQPTASTNLSLTDSKSPAKPSTQEMINSADKALEDLGKNNKTASYQCFDKSKDTLKSFYDMYITMSKLQVSGKVDPATAHKVIALSKTFVTGGIWNIIEASSRCAEALNGERSADFAKLKKGWTKVLKVINTIKVLADCGVDLGYGGYILVQNSACLAQDVVAVFDGWAKTDQLENNFVNSPISTEGERDSVHETSGCMAKLGVQLQSLHSYFDVTTTSYTCAEYCGNNGKKTKHMKANMLKIYPVASDRQMCEQVVSTPQSENSIRQCMSFCCYQNGTCSNKAFEKLKSYGL